MNSSSATLSRHSARSARSGSTLAATRPGLRAATRAKRSTHRAATPSTTPSRPEVPNRRGSSRAESPSARSSPRPAPAAAAPAPPGIGAHFDLEQLPQRNPERLHHPEPSLGRRVRMLPVHDLRPVPAREADPERPVVLAEPACGEEVQESLLFQAETHGRHPGRPQGSSRRDRGAKPRNGRPPAKEENRAKCSRSFALVRRPSRRSVPRGSDLSVLQPARAAPTALGAECPPRAPGSQPMAAGRIAAPPRLPGSSPSPPGPPA